MIVLMLKTIDFLIIWQVNRLFIVIGIFYQFSNFFTTIRAEDEPLTLPNLPL